MVWQIEQGLFRVAIPVPFPMKYVYCYLIKDEDGWVLIDTGVNSDAARKTWKWVFSRLRIQPQDISSIYLTHFHPDHCGLAGLFQEETKVPVWISRRDRENFLNVFFKELYQSPVFFHYAIENGMPEHIVFKIKENMERLCQLVLPLPELSVMDRDHVLIGGKRWEIIAVPGHSDGHITFYQKEKKLFRFIVTFCEKYTINMKKLAISWQSFS